MHLYIANAIISKNQTIHNENSFVSGFYKLIWQRETNENNDEKAMGAIYQA